MDNQQLRIEVLLEEVVRRKASGLHLQVSLPPMLRIDGALIPMAGYNPLDEAGVETLVFAILDQDQRQILIKDKEFDFSFAFGTLGRFRVNAYNQNRGAGAVFRTIPSKVLTMEQLGMGQVFKNISETPRGMILAASVLTPSTNAVTWQRRSDLSLMRLKQLPSLDFRMSC